MKQEFNAAYWQQRYQNNQTGWDTQGITTPLKAYFDQLTNKELRILIPGCGNAYEAEYLFKNGFKNVFVADVAPSPLENFADRVQDFPKEQLLLQNFFDLQGPYDLIVEQTFFCAISPDLRASYARKCAELLAPGGRVVGLLFDTEFTHEGPPFGGSADEYRKYFEPYFKLIHFEKAYNSIAPRQGRELFINLKKK
ncbi:methyltransferase domain-containing protein [Pontibacter sp. BT310]|uniref:Methyltransferase domain-containing protein n=1 Tax=Pontibacter populi TaxID=890055 RepID=A0ABS6XB71_9BACT|nr:MULTISPECIES: methyltransferase [Pontibacter]MBJ6118403.1 methyltransferase domain-containing protein [Pontibacter sp. BT310]MBR0570831.1 methyltransferase domain-containing protein [Microvirga sp. STS03]MBW3365257.1 methyltransferase domain-containing protein [Pontibacter populi]